MLKLVSSKPDFYSKSGNAAVVQGVGYGCECANCGRDISAPFGYERKLVWCLYCGFESGCVPLVEHPYGHRWSFGVMREENIQDVAALERGDFQSFEAMCRDRACKNGQIINLF